MFVYKAYKKQKKHLNTQNREVFLKKCEVITMMNNKKGADLSMNVIIIAAIALLVLVILAVLLFRSGGQVSEGTQCTGFGGQCHSQGNGPNNFIRNPAFDGECESSGQVCYVPLGNVN